MVFYYLCFFIYLAEIIEIKSINIKNDSSVVKKIISPNYYERFLKQYDINLQLIENNNNIKEEIFINTSYLSKSYKFEFLYMGKFLFLNDTNLDLSPYKNDYMNYLLIIDKNTIFNYYIENINLIKDFAKIIIIPKSKNNNININSRALFVDFSIYLIEVEENIFNKLLDIYNNHNNYYGKIISKKLEFLFNKEFKTKIIIILIFLLLFFPFYKVIVQKIYYNYLIYIQLQIYFLLKIKIFILFCIYLELNRFIHLHGFYLYKNSFLMKLANFVLVMTKYDMTCIILISFSGLPLFLKIRTSYLKIISLISRLSMVLELYCMFVSSEKKPYSLYMGNLFLYIIILFLFVFFTLRTLIQLFKLITKIKKCQKYKIYLKSLRLKLCISIALSIAFVFYFFYFFSLNEYIKIKKDLILEIETKIIIQCLESCLILILAIIFLPTNKVYGFNHILNIIKHKTETITPNQFYRTNIPKPSIENRKEITNFLLKIYKKPLIILKPKAFSKKNKENENLLASNVNTGKLIF